MRFPIPALVAAAGILAAFAVLPFALAADAPASPVVRRAYVPGLAGDSAAGYGAPATTTPTGTVPASPTQTLGTCAGERSTIRTLGDPDATFSRTPVTASVFELLDLQRPTVTAGTARIAPTEARVVQMNAWLRGFIRKNNGAIELLISAAPGGAIMVAGFPPADCLSGTSALDQAAIEAARTALINRCGMPVTSGITELAGPITLTGVPFWGQPRNDGLSGAFNGIELGPVLSFAKTDDLDCKPASYEGGGNGTPTATPVPKSITINISPTTAARGATIAVTIQTQPPAPGVSCSFIAWGNDLQLLAESSAKTTGAAGSTNWTFTIPANAALGSDARVTPSCTGYSTTGSARLTITP